MGVYKKKKKCYNGFRWETRNKMLWVIHLLLSHGTPDWVFCYLSQTDNQTIVIIIKVTSCLFEKVCQSCDSSNCLEVKSYLRQFSKTPSNNCSNPCHSGQSTEMLRASVLLHLTYLRLYFDILDPILFCLHMLPMGSIKTTTNTEKSINPSPSDHMQPHSLLTLHDPALRMWNAELWDAFWS